MENTYTQYNVPDVSIRINLGVGQPSPKLLNWENFQNSLKSLDEKNPKIMQYGYIPGFEEYRELIVNILKNYSNDNICESKDIFMTNGISQAVFMLGSLLHKNYSKVYVQDPTYFIMLNMLRDLGYQFDIFNLNNLNNLDELLNNDLKNNIKSLIYLVPYNQNPTGETINNFQLQNLKVILTKYSDNLLLSDETYQLLNFNKEDIQLSLVSQLNLQNVISLGTFSKLIAPALRLGWIYTKNQNIHNLLNTCGFMDSGGAVNQIMAKLLCNYLQKYNLDQIIDNTMEFLKTNCNKLCKILDKYPEFFEYNKPKGGYFIWVKNKVFDGPKFQQVCSENNIGYHLGNKFSPFQNFSDYFRLSFSYYDNHDYDYFERRLDNSINQYLEKYKKITINLYGSNGRLGKLICQEAEQNIFKINKLSRDLSNLLITDNSIIVDVSTIEGTTNMINTLLTNNYTIPIIIGTTGNLPFDLINIYAEKIGKSKVFVCSNFSIGVSSIVNYLQNLIPNYWCVSMEEHHHIHKKDAPSGTAINLKKALADNIQNKDFEIKSVREGEIIGYHKIHLFNEYEEITIIHNAKDRALFAKGCLEYVKKMIL